MSARAVLSLGLLLLVVPLWAWSADEEDLRWHEKTLRAAQVADDGASLLAFFRKRTLSTEERARLAELVKRLGDEEFAEREKAVAGLVAAGPAARPLLAAALHDPDLEVVQRARQCLARLSSERHVVVAAAHVLAARRPAGAVAVLLAYLPQADGQEAQLAVRAALASVGIHDDHADPLLVAALADAEPLRRGAAAAVLGRLPGQRAAVARLLQDAHAEVQLDAALALARAGQRSAVPVLIALLVDAPAERAGEAEDLLIHLAGPRSPSVVLGTNAESRRQSRDAWQRWYKEHGATADLGVLSKVEPVLGLRVVCELVGSRHGTGRILAFGPDNEIRWEIHDVAGPLDVRLLPGGRVLSAEINTKKVVERNLEGKVLWEFDMDHMPMSCQRLSNGNTFIATDNELMEVTPDKKKAWSIPRPGGILSGEKLLTGHLLTVDRAGTITELDTDGKVLRTVAGGDTSNWGSVERLRDGHFLVARCGVHQVVEIDAEGKECWKVGIDWPTWASRLSNGHTLVACANSGQVVEFDRAGNRVWEQKLPNRPARCRRY
jgi:hypothetical protein